MMRELCFLGSAAGVLPAFFWAGQGILAALGGRGPGFGPEAVLLAGVLCLGYALGWLYLPQDPAGPDGLTEETPNATKALLPNSWRGELCSSIVSNQS